MTKTPKTRCSGTMSESSFFSFIRSGLRQKSQRWRPIYDAKKEAQIPYTGSDKRTKFLYICAICNESFKGTEVCVDHIVPCGSLKSFDDIGGFCERLFCEVDGLRVLCKPCHQQVTNQERNKSD
jgi:5-methylcytosine-specific restriction endonuclease McrA